MGWISGEGEGWGVELMKPKRVDQNFDPKYHFSISIELSVVLNTSDQIYGKKKHDD